MATGLDGAVESEWMGMLGEGAVEDMEDELEEGEGGADRGPGIGRRVILPSPRACRFHGRHGDQRLLHEAASLRHGHLQSDLAGDLPGTARDKYFVIAGETRWGTQYNMWTIEY